MVDKDTKIEMTQVAPAARPISIKEQASMVEAWANKRLGKYFIEKFKSDSEQGVHKYTMLLNSIVCGSANQSKEYHKGLKKFYKTVMELDEDTAKQVVAEDVADIKARLGKAFLPGIDNPGDERSI